jgi:hypothetical protein
MLSLNYDFFCKFVTPAKNKQWGTTHNYYLAYKLKKGSVK